MPDRSDVVVVGGGIVGLATAWQSLKLHPEHTVTLIEKESRLGEHQTGHNSGVLHSGIYYKPGSLKAINCREGKKAMEAFCTEENIPYEICGKVIVAVDEGEIPLLKAIYDRGRANGIRCEWIGPERLAELEPETSGRQAVHVPEAGIVNYRAVCERLATRIAERGGTIVTGARLTGFRNERNAVILETSIGAFEAARAVNCTGLHSDRVARLTGTDPGVRIVPFRGEYYELKPEARTLCRNLIYPVPDPNFPFLGVHFTRMISGHVECGPNAVLAFAREGYTRTNINLRDLTESLAYPGFQKLARKYWRAGLGEMWRSFNKQAFVKALQRLVPAITSRHLETAPAGVRAQALLPDGALVDDFLIVDSDRVVNICNAPSPAATASLNIGRLIVESLVRG